MVLEPSTAQMNTVELQQKKMEVSMNLKRAEDGIRNMSRSTWAEWRNLRNPSIDV